jgi:hypothetical protein
MLHFTIPSCVLCRISFKLQTTKHLVLRRHYDVQSHCCSHIDHRITYKLQDMRTFTFNGTMLPEKLVIFHTV